MTSIANKRILISVPDCPWLSPTDHINLLQCVDGSFCNAWTDSAGWSCCKEHGGRAKCPKNLPLMCAAEKGCAEGSDHCCEKECSSYGGLRKCGRLSRKIFWADKVTLLIHWYLGDLNLMCLFFRNRKLRIHLWIRLIKLQKTTNKKIKNIVMNSIKKTI